MHLTPNERTCTYVSSTVKHAVEESGLGIEELVFVLISSLSLACSTIADVIFPARQCRATVLNSRCDRRLRQQRRISTLA